jgi:hypothetical protein
LLQNEGLQTFLSKDPEVWAVVHAKWHAYMLSKYLSLQVWDGATTATTVPAWDGAAAATTDTTEVPETDYGLSPADPYHTNSTTATLSPADPVAESDYVDSWEDTYYEDRHEDVYYEDPVYYEDDSADSENRTSDYVPNGSLHYKPDLQAMLGSHTNNVVSALDSMRKVVRKASKFSQELYKVFVYWASNNMDTFENAQEDFMQWLNNNQDKIIPILRMN